MIPTKINGKYDIILPEHRADRPEYHSKEGWERARLDSMHKHIGKGDVVYSVGSEEADMTGLMAIWGAELVLFEPNDKVWPNAKAIWESNKLDSPLATFSGFAANETYGQGLYIGKFPPSAEGDIISDHGFKNLDENDGTIPSIKIDDIVFIHGVKPPTVIEFDCEGSGFEVLKGAERVLREYKPMIFASWHPEFKFDKYNIYLNDVRQWVKDIGYREELLAYDHEVHMKYTGARNG